MEEKRAISLMHTSEHRESLEISCKQKSDKESKIQHFRALEHFCGIFWPLAANNLAVLVTFHPHCKVVHRDFDVFALSLLSLTPFCSRKKYLLIFERLHTNSRLSMSDAIQQLRPSRHERLCAVLCFICLAELQEAVRVEDCF